MHSLACVLLQSQFNKRGVTVFPRHAMRGTLTAPWFLGLIQLYPHTSNSESGRLNADVSVGAERPHCSHGALRAGNISMGSLLRGSSLSLLVHSRLYRTCSTLSTLADDHTVDSTLTCYSRVTVLGFYTVTYGPYAVQSPSHKVDGSGRLAAFPDRSCSKSGRMKRLKQRYARFPAGTVSTRDEKYFDARRKSNGPDPPYLAHL